MWTTLFRKKGKSKGHTANKDDPFILVHFCSTGAAAPDYQVLSFYSAWVDILFDGRRFSGLTPEEDVPFWSDLVLVGACFLYL